MISSDISQPATPLQKLDAFVQINDGRNVSAVDGWIGAVDGWIGAM